MNARSVLTKILIDERDHLSYFLQEHPHVVAAVMTATDTLGPVLMTYPQALTRFLERSPETLIEVAQRSPKLMTTLCLKCPDVLIEPLEKNPMIVVTLLSRHRDLVLAIPFQELGIDVFPNRCKTFQSTSVQTETLAIAPVQPHVIMATSKLQQKHHNMLSHILKKRSKVQHAMGLSDVMREISKLYVKKLAFDAMDDRAGLDRY